MEGMLLQAKPVASLVNGHMALNLCVSASLDNDLVDALFRAPFIFTFVPEAGSIRIDGDLDSSLFSRVQEDLLEGMQFADRTLSRRIWGRYVKLQDLMTSNAASILDVEKSVDIWL